MTRVEEIAEWSTSGKTAHVRAAAQLACLLEASAPKPGNVSPGRPFADLRYEDFLASAVAIGEPMAGAAARGVGTTVRLAVEATRQWTRSNTNLGIVLLFVPLARAALATNGGLDATSLRAAVRDVLASTTVDDAREAYAAIRLARPGGLDRVEVQDVAAEPTLPLTEVMRLAAHRDGVAREYATGFEVTFEVAVPALERARRDGLVWDDRIVETFLTVLAAGPDTHIARRSGAGRAAGATALARDAVAEGGVRTERGRTAIDAMDRALRDVRNSGNPGTTADLTAAAIFAALLVGGFDAATR
jgi:triphosphoribosyl-dephospho-CoA synthase